MQNLFFIVLLPKTRIPFEFSSDLVEIETMT